MESACWFRRTKLSVCCCSVFGGVMADLTGNDVRMWQLSVELVPYSLAIEREHC